MTNVSKNLLFAFAVFVSAAVLSLGAFATTVHAEYYDGGFDLGGGGGYDYGSYDVGGYDYGSYDVGAYDYGSYDVGGYDYGSYDVGGYDYGSYDVGAYDYGSYDVGGYDYGSYDVGAYDYGSYDVGGYDYGSYDIGGYDYGYVDSYMDSYAQDYGSYGGSSYGGYSNGYSYTPSFSSTGGCTSCHTQTYTNPGCTYNCNPKPTPTQYCPSGTTGTYPNCKYPQPTPTPKPNPTCSTCGGGSNITNVNTNTNTNIHTDSHNYTDNSYTNNSINGSFNTNINNSGNTHISTVTPVVPQQQIVYTYQQQIAAPYCVITLQNAGAYSTTATLVWSSNNATSAYISQVGSVAVNGTRVVTGYANQTYSLTVTGQGGTYTCVSQPFTPTYVPPAPITPSVSLTQIPYTGLALSPLAQAMYWLSLIAVAAAGGYLLVYFKGGALALAATGVARRQNHFVVSEQTEQEVEEVVAPAVEEAVEEVAAPAVSAFSLPTMETAQTRDSMQVIRNAMGVPQIIINRA